MEEWPESETDYCAIGCELSDFLGWRFAYLALHSVSPGFQERALSAEVGRQRLLGKLKLGGNS